MHKFTVRFRSLRDVQEFVALASKQSFPMTIGSERFQVNATSFMGLFALNFRKPQQVSVQCTQEEFEVVLQTLQRFLAE